ncbi:MAG: cbb3-type cytochrome c oxidase subunit II [Spirochaetia bacterium]|nr:cbb3-type cytochrome c oxidase subunit II [Spirochaetia bacterium]
MKTVCVTVVFVFLGYYMQVRLPYHNLNGNGTFALLTSPDPLAVQGQIVYMQEGCQYCHTQNLRPFPSEVRRYADEAKYGFFPLQTAQEGRFQSPYPRGSVRIGPDLSRIASKYTVDTMQSLLKSKAGDSPKGAFHSYKYLFAQDMDIDAELTWRIRQMLNTGAVISDPFLQSAHDRVRDKTRGDALVAYLLTLGQAQAEYAGKFYPAQ